MTELERARAHLQVCQYDLAGARLLQWCLAGERRLRFVEEAYLAALSWVWDAQERASTDVRMGIYQGGMPVRYALSHAPRA